MEAPAQQGKKVRKLVARQPPHNATVTQQPPPSPVPPSRNLTRNRVRKIRARTPPSPLPQRPQSNSSVLQPHSTTPPLQPQSTQVEDREPASSEAYDFSGRKKKRGKSRGKGVHDIIEANDGKKILVIFDLGLKVPENEIVSAYLTSEMGSTVRIHAPVCHMGWRNVPLEDKRHLYEKLLVLFEVDLVNPKILEYVDTKMAKLYSVFKWRLHQHYLAYGTHHEGRANLPHFELWNGRPEGHWHWLCDKDYTAEDFMNGAQFSVIDNWETLHKDKNNQWVHDAAREKYDEMTQRRDECKEKLIVEASAYTPHDYVHVPLEAELEIMSETLGRKGRSIRGVGSFPRMEIVNSFTTSSLASKSQVAEFQDPVKLLATKFTIMEKENEQLKARVRALSKSQGQTSSGSDEARNDDYDELADYDDVDD